MQSTFETAFAAVQALAKDFEENSRHYLSASYQEAEVRKAFIDKFLIALGWDVNHDYQKNPFEQEVHVERGVNMQGARKRADYAFYIAPNFRDVRLFVEAKKPAGDIATAQNYFQTIRYGWNAQTPVAVLTDFEQLQILDCRYKPDVDTALSHCIQKFHYSEYADHEKFAVIYHLFSREAVAAGSLDKFAAGLPKKRGKAVQRGLFKGGWQSIDEAFLEDLDGYRDVLARSFKNRNPQLDGDALTEITQRTIDRLVFIRFLEDKMIHPENLISEFGNKGTAWKDFIAASCKLDGIYNGIVFKQHTILDAPSFKVDDNEFADICKKLAHVNSPYDFNSIPIHILGSIYERFLGKVIVTTAKRATLEEKPEVRKAGGVYYTPEYIVRYIVENTVGKQIDGKTPAQIAEMRFADIACGSGSFLLGVFDLLLSYHGKWFTANPDKAKKAGCVLGDDGAWHLSLKQRREILVNNIYGVDIDNQAVEVAQLSLYLKLLEEETTASARQHQLEFHETILPSLNKNIVCGNSLIGTDILTGQLFASDEERKLNPMDYEQRFPEIMKRGGFDAIVGNPPYGATFGDQSKKYISEKYSSYRYKYDSYIYFIERAIRLTKSGGYVSYITPEPWLKLESAEALRTFIRNKSELVSVKICGENVFAAAVVNTVVVVLRSGLKTKQIQIIQDERNWVMSDSIWESSDGLAIDYRLHPEINSIMQRFKKPGIVPLSNFGEAIQGITPYDKYRGQSSDIIKQRGYHFDHKKDKTCEKWLAGEDVDRYGLSWSGEWLSYGPWLGAPREPRFFTGSRLLFREIPGKDRRIQATLAEKDTCYHGHSITPFKLNEGKAQVSILYILGVSNSKLLSWYGGLVLPNFGKTIFPKLNPQDIKALPIRQIDFSTASDKARHDKMVSLVEQMLAAKKQLAAAQSDKDKDFYGHKCESLDRQIDALVYELYGLTDEEIAIVEGSGA